MSAAKSIPVLMAGIRSGNLKRTFHAALEIALHGNSSVEHLRPLLRNRDEKLLTRVWAIFALEHIGLSALGSCRQELMSLLHDPSPALRRAALGALGNLRDPALVPDVAAFLDDQQEDPNSWDEEDSRVCHAAARALERIGTAEALAALRVYRSPGA